jgi:hypothetical protein
VNKHLRHALSSSIGSAVGLFLLNFEPLSCLIGWTLSMAFLTILDWEGPGEETPD